MSGYADHIYELMVISRDLSAHDVSSLQRIGSKNYITEVNYIEFDGVKEVVGHSLVEGINHIKTDKLVFQSEKVLVDCNVKQGNQGCSAGFMEKAMVQESLRQQQLQCLQNTKSKLSDIIYH